MKKWFLENFPFFANLFSEFNCFDQKKNKNSILGKAFCCVVFIFSAGIIGLCVFYGFLYRIVFNVWIPQLLYLAGLFP